MSSTRHVAGPEIVEAFSLRIPMTLRKRLVASAQGERRSLNGQIIYLLERALPAENEKAETAATVPAE